MIKLPDECCKDCKMRHEACHDRCMYYKRSREKYEAMKDQIKQDKLLGNAFDQIAADRSVKNKRYWKK